ncbi:snaclec alboaggregin-A subunit beta'-like [Nerophis lumbriciformis]|uniref:snaclec alboaggregin-A subunit beta'-like n=1 Tax=Nerophis lumbriciformis TaxID=546530 RepID=UPI002AE058C7|nr:ladderlectin-like [Nerophis lumbriciformis]
MAFTLRVLFLLCGISGLFTGVLSNDSKKKDSCCPEGWTRLDDHCYVVKDDPRTFADAEEVCQLLHGNLASVTSAVKNAVVYQLVLEENLSSAWIGYHDALQNSDFLWTDGSDPDAFVNFAGGSPTDSGDCVIITTDGEWSDVDCETTEAYACITDVCCH